MIAKQLKQKEKNAASCPAFSEGCYFYRLDILKYIDHYKIRTTMMLHLLKLYSKDATNHLQSW